MVGLRFLRSLRLMSFPDILQYLNVLKTSSSIRLAQLISILVSVWLTAAGLIHLVGGSVCKGICSINLKSLFCMPFGTTWLARKLGRSAWLSKWPLHVLLGLRLLSHCDDVYRRLRRHSLHDHTRSHLHCTCHSRRSRRLCLLHTRDHWPYWLTAQVQWHFQVRTKAVSEKSFFIVLRSRLWNLLWTCRHIVVCGHINFESVSNFLKDFLHEDREDVDVEVVFLHRKPPDLELEGLIKRHFTTVEFFQGSVMNPIDLSRVKVYDADACLVLANKYCQDPDAEDAANIMRVISIKNYSDNIRVSD